FQRVSQLAEQPCVLDGDYGLSGEVPNQLDLLFSEWTYVLTKNSNKTEQIVFSKHRHYNERSGAGEIHHRNERRIFFQIEDLRSQIRNLHRLSRSGDARERVAWIGFDYGIFAAELNEGVGHIVRCRKWKLAGAMEVQCAEVGFAKMRRICQHAL